MKYENRQFLAKDVYWILVMPVSVKCLREMGSRLTDNHVKDWKRVEVKQTIFWKIYGIIAWHCPAELTSAKLHKKIVSLFEKCIKAKNHNTADPFDNVENGTFTSPMAS